MVMAKKVLVIDDDLTFICLIEAVLGQEGFEVIRANNGREGLRHLFSQKPDLVLLDVIMPQLDGWQTCRRIREVCDIPIIMVTGWCQAEENIVRGLDYGADDYILKPVGNKQLVARVRAALRRAELPSSLGAKPGFTYNDGFLSVDVAERRVMVGGERVRLTSREFGLLALLVDNAGRILSHRQLLEKVWGWEYIDDVDYVRIYIARLRHKIEPDPAKPRYIITEPGVGYRFQKVA